MSWDKIGLLRHRIIGILPMTIGFLVTVGFVVAILDLPVPHLNILVSCNFFMPSIANRQPLRRPSIQTPPTIAAIYFLTS